MFTLAAIADCTAHAQSYPGLAAGLRDLGMHSYTVDVASHATLYRSTGGDVLVQPGQALAKPVLAAFSAEALAVAIARNQRRESSYAGFMQEIAAAGVKRYEAILVGPRPRCIYFGGNGFVEEAIPLQEETNMKAAESQVLSVYVERPLGLVAEFLANPLNMNRWAKGLGHSLHQENGEWRAAGPEGPVRVRFSPCNDFAIADHWVEVAPGVEIHVPLRAIAHGDGCDVQLVLLRLPAMSDEEYARDADLMRLDLATLKSVLEAK